MRVDDDFTQGAYRYKVCLREEVKGMKGVSRGGCDGTSSERPETTQNSE